jgi:hypothetical protein
LLVINLRLERLDLQLQRLVLFHLATQETSGQGHIFFNACDRSHINVIELVLAVIEVSLLHMVFLGEDIQALVLPADPHVMLPR